MKNYGHGPIVIPDVLKKMSKSFGGSLTSTPIPYPPLKDHSPSTRDRLPKLRKILDDEKRHEGAGKTTTEKRQSFLKMQSMYPPLKGRSPSGRQRLPKLIGERVVQEAKNEQLKQSKLKFRYWSVHTIQELIYLGGELAKVQNQIRKTIVSSKEPDILPVILAPLKDKEAEFIAEIQFLKDKMRGFKSGKRTGRGGGGGGGGAGSDNGPLSSTLLGGAGESNTLLGSARADVLMAPTGLTRQTMPLSGGLSPFGGPETFSQRLGGADMP